MKLWIFSDLHLEYGWLGLDFEVPQADLCIVAGGIYRGGPRRSIEFLAEHVPELPVVFVAGNDEFRDSSVFEGFVDAGREADRCANIHMLEDDCVQIGDLWVAGATLWTDFSLNGDQTRTMRYCQRMMVDYSSISWSMKPPRPLQPRHTLQKHRVSVAFLNEFLEKHRDDRTLVVTHHAPSGRFLCPNLGEASSMAASASSLDALIEARGPDLWIHGHVPVRLDYSFGKTRVVCNPRGFYGDPNFEAFDLGCVIDI